MHDHADQDNSPWVQLRAAIESAIGNSPLLRLLIKAVDPGRASPDVPAGTGQTDTITRRALPPGVQVRVVGAVALAALVLVAFVYGAGALIAFFGSTRSGEAAVETAAPGTFRPTPAQLASLVIKPVKAMNFAAVTSTDGYIANDDDITTPVYSPFSGRVTRLVAKLGDHVRKGDTLMVVQASEFVQAQNDLITAMSNLHSTRAQLDLAQTNEKREHELYDARGAALKDWQQSQSDLATAQGNYRTAEIALAAVRNRLRIFGKSDREIEALESARIDHSTTPEAPVVAPIDGTVILRQVGLGQFIQSGAGNPVYSIGDLSKVWLIANVRETDAPQMHVGDPVNVEVLAFPGRVFKATLAYVAPAIDPNTHRLQVRAEVANPDGLLKPQMFASFSIVTGDTRRAEPAVPQSAIVTEGDEARVWVMNRDGTLGLRRITIGRESGDTVEVLSGLTAHDRVVTGGAIFIDRAATSD